MASSGERVICSVCSEKIILKNLKTHYSRNHPTLPVKYNSATNKNIGKFFEPPVKKLKQAGETYRPTTESSTVVPSSSFDEEKTDRPDPCPTPEPVLAPTVSFDYEQIQTLLKKVDVLTNALQSEKLKTAGCTRDTRTLPIATGPPPTTTPTEVPKELTTEEKLDLITSARSVEGLLKWAGYFERSEFGILCTACVSVLSYDFAIGDSFNDSTMPDSFRHLKYDLKRHLTANSHKENVAKLDSKKLSDERLFSEGKKNAIHCASAAYLTYKLNASNKSYESIITEMYNSGSSVGVTNHSKEFPRLFLPHLHSVLVKEISSYIIDNDLPVGIIADKVTINHRSRHVVGLRVPIFDISCQGLFNCVYLEHNFVQDFTGKGLTESILSTCHKFGFDSNFLRNNLVGMAFDGQYIKLGVEKHMKDELVLDDLSVSWDIMHRIELAEKHSSMPDLIQKGHTLIDEVMKEFSTGKKYELLLQSSKEFEDYFYKPKSFKTMKFASHSEAVFKAFLGDYRSLVSATEKCPESFAVRDKLISKSNIFIILLLTDLYSILSSLSKEVQSSYLLPWQYTQLMENIQYHLDIMIKYITEISSASSRQDLCNIVKKLPDNFFKQTKLSVEFIEDNSTFKGVPLTDMPVSSKILRSVTPSSSNKVVNEMTKCCVEFLKLVTSLQEQCKVYLNPDEENHTIKMIKMADMLFNLDFLIFPNSKTLTNKVSQYLDSFESFNEIVNACKYSFLNTADKKQLYFEYKQILTFMVEKLTSERNKGNVIELKYLFKEIVTNFKVKNPLAVKLLEFLITTPVSEAICESWGSIITSVMKKRPTASDHSLEEVGTTDKLTFVLINGPPPGYKGNKRFLKLALCQRYGSQYYNHFKPASKHKIMDDMVTSKVVTRIQEDLCNCLPCFKF